MIDTLTGFCNTPFWDFDLIWNGPFPDFTNCFQNTIFIWVPLAFLIISCPLIFLASNKGLKSNQWSLSIVTKLVINVALFGVAIAELVWTTAYSESFSPAAVTAAALKIFTYILTGLIMWVERKNGSTTSAILFFFWLVQSLASVITYYSMMIRLFQTPYLESVTLHGLKLAETPMILLQFLLTFVADVPSMNYFRRDCPELRSSYISQMVFGWIDPLLYRGFKKPLTQKKLWKLSPGNTTHNIVTEFDGYWDYELQKAKRSGWDVNKKAETESKDMYLPSFIFALWKCHWKDFLFAALQKTISDLLAFVSPQVLNLIITFVTSDEPLWKGFFYSFIVFGAAELQSLFQSQYFIRMFVVGMKIRMALISAVYKKALRITSKEKQDSTVGEIVNLMSIDTQRFVDVMPFILMLYSAPLQMALALYFLSNVLGISVIGGVVVMILLFPLNAVIASVSRKLQITNMKLKDERTKLMTEILNGIKVLKLYAWEIPFGNMVEVIRDKEVKILKKLAYYMAGISFVWTCAPFFVSLASFAMFVLIDEKNILTANVAFVSLSLFNLLRFPMNMLPSLITALIQVSVSVKRLNKFLRGEEIDETEITHHNLGGDDITIENGEFSWGRQTNGSSLVDINLNIPKGNLVAVVGQVGSGKSSLISAMLGEMCKMKGKINIQGSVAYVPQQAWIQNATVKSNILMYKQDKPRFYEDILSACSLKSDLDILPGGDETEIGEKGINLSGGQKQRVSLARAVYHNSSIYLLDDPLSAVDSHVGKHIFENVIGPSGLLKHKTRIFVTNGISYLPQCDMIVVLKDGCISEIGSYSDLLRRKGAFSEFLLQYLTQEIEHIDEQDIANLDELLSQVPPTVMSPELQRELSRKLSGSESEMESEKSGRRKKPGRSESIKSTKSSRHGSIKSTSEGEAVERSKLIQVEKMETAEVKIDVYIQYLKKIGVPMGIGILLTWVASQACSVGSNVWLSEWSNDPVQPDGTVDTSLRDMRLGVYGALGVGQGVGIMMGAFGLAYGSMKASNELHKLMLDCVLKSPMSYFDTTPIGRIVNRFSKDINVMDTSISMNFRGWLMTFLQVISIIIVDVISTPFILLVLAPASILYYFIQKVYIASSRQLKRLESVTRSPIYNHFSESVTGASSIRAYDVQDIFLKESFKRVDTNMICYYPSVIANRWLAIRLEFVGNLIVLFASLFAVLSKGSLSGGAVGLSVSYAMSITSSLNWMVRMSSELETNIVSVERILEYSNLESEAEWDKDFNRQNTSWPQEGRIEFNNYQTRYRADLDLVLKGINCSVRTGEKIGICGRTGAGKSSLTLALFRIIESASGNIVIDDVDISKLGLHNLRSRLTIIPQDPVLFSGNLRQNLDPFEKHSDAEIWSVLEHAHLKDFVSSVNDGLSYGVAEGGENLSVGQRQLICLARALLRKTKILILDEATAAIDLETDDLIQDTIRKEFADCTILTIAHRLNTIMDSARIMVLDKGFIAEFDSPQNLLQNKNSVFYGMAKDAGLV